MELQHIIEHLTKKHYEKDIQFTIFENHKQTDKFKTIRVSDLFTKQDWESGISLLHRLKMQGEGNECFNNFWGRFLVKVTPDLEKWKEYVSQNSLNVEKFLKHILVLLGHGAVVKDLQEKRSAMSMIIQISEEKGLFGGISDAIHIADTLRCYGNWWRHGYEKTPEDEKDKSKTTDKSAMIIPSLNDDENDFKFLLEHVRTILVLFLYVTRNCYSQIESRITPVSKETSNEEIFNQSKFLNLYFSNLQEHINRELNTQAIKELQDENELGYFEHTLRFSHCTMDDSSELEDEDDKNITKKIKLSQFRKDSTFKTNIILGMPGAGKTTALYMLVNECTRQYLNITDPEKRSSVLVPIFISLRSIVSKTNQDAIKGAINQEIGHRILEKDTRYREMACKFIYDLIMEGCALLFFDGLNEISQEEAKPIISDLKNFIERLPEDSKIFITSRKYEYESSFYSNEFNKIASVGIWHLEELSFEQIKNYLRPETRSHIINSGIVEMFSSPLNLRLYLNYTRKKSKDNKLVMPLNRGEVLDTFLHETLSNIKSSKTNKSYLFHANKLLLKMATSYHGRQWDTDLFENCIDNQPEDLIYRLAATNILAITPACADKDEQVSFSIDTFQEFFRAKYIIEKLEENKKLSLYSLSSTDNAARIDPNSSDDFETLKLVFEVGSSPLRFIRKGKTPEDSKNKAAAFSARLAKDFLNPEPSLSETEVINPNSDFIPRMNSRLLTLCHLTRNITFSEDKDINEKSEMNAKDIAELMVINNLRWFRVKHPVPIVVSKKLPSHSYLKGLMKAAATIGGSNIWDEIISTYWFFTFGILSPYDYTIEDSMAGGRNPKEKLKLRFSSAYAVLRTLVNNCRDYILVYDKLHDLHRHMQNRKRDISRNGISSFLYQFFLYFQPDYTKKHLFYHLSDMYGKNPQDSQLLSDINTILCYCGDSQLLVENFRFDSNGQIRIKELRNILCNFADTATQKFVLTEKFFNMIQPVHKDEDLRSMTIRHFLFRVGLTPIMKDFLFKKGGLNMIPQVDVEGIMDMIPLNSIPKEYIEENYDTNICNLLIKEREAETEDRVGYVYFGKEEGDYIVAINDIMEDALVGEDCNIGTEKFKVISDSYKDTARLHCRVKARDNEIILLPQTGIIKTQDETHKITYQAPSPGLVLDFYMYASDAAELFSLYKEGSLIFIGERECLLELPGIKNDKHLDYRPFRIIKIRPSKEDVLLPYSGEIVFSKQIDKTTRPRAAYDAPERYEYLSNDLELKRDKLRYRVFGQNKSFLWVITEKVITAACLLTGCNTYNPITKERYNICSIKPHNTPYMEFWFKVSQRISVPAYGSFSILDCKGEYRHIPFCFSAMSEDRYNFRLRVTYDDIPELSAKELHKVTYMFGNTHLQLVSAERINPNRRYTFWALRKQNKSCNTTSGEFYILGKDNRKQTITLSGETRTTIKHITCELASYDKTTGEVTFIAKSPEGKIGNGTGNHNLLKGLFLCSTITSSVRLPIEKGSEMTPLWIKRMYIRFNIIPHGKIGHMLINDSKISYVRQDNDYVLWCNSNSSVTADQNLKTLLEEIRDIEMVSEDGSRNSLRIMEIKEGERVPSNPMIIRSHCREEFSGLLDGRNFEFNLQSFMPVLNQPEFPKSFKVLYPTYSVRYIRDIRRDGTIIIPRPVNLINADSVTLDGGLNWKIKYKSQLGDKLLMINLVDEGGRTPRLLVSNGTVSFQTNRKNTQLWFGSLIRLIDRDHPEKYHAETCDKFLDEMIGDEHVLDRSTLNFFIKKSRVHDLASNDRLLHAIDELEGSMLDICRVLSSNPLKGLEAYSLVNDKKLPSEDTMPENHGGREFQWMDLVLMERNHKLTIANDLPRYRCLGYKDGFILKISKPDKRGRQMLIIVSTDSEEKQFSYFFDPNKDTRDFKIGDCVNFFATVNYNDTTKLAAESILLIGTRRTIYNAEYIGYDIESNYNAYRFNLNGEIVKVTITHNAPARIQRYNTELIVGKKYKMMIGSKKYFLVE